MAEITLIFNAKEEKVKLKKLSPKLEAICYGVQDDFNKSLNEDFDKALNEYDKYLTLEDALEFTSILESSPALQNLDLTGLSKEEIAKKMESANINPLHMNFDVLKPLVKKITHQLKRKKRNELDVMLGHLLIDKSKLPVEYIESIDSDLDVSDENNFWASQYSEELEKIGKFFRG